AATPGTPSSISRGKSCPSPAAIGQVTQSEDWYKTVQRLTCLITKVFSTINAPVLVLRKQSRASPALQTTGSLALNNVLRTLGVPVRARKLSNKRYLRLPRCARSRPGTLRRAGRGRLAPSKREVFNPRIITKRISSKSFNAH